MRKNVLLDISWESCRELQDLAEKYGVRLASTKDIDFALLFKFNEIEEDKFRYGLSVGYNNLNNDSIEDLREDLEDFKEELEELLEEYEELADEPDMDEFDTEDEYEDALSDMVLEIFRQEFDILVYEKVIEERCR